MSDWEEIHQPFELDYQQNEGFRWRSDDEEFNRRRREIFSTYKVNFEKVLDIGCGPRSIFEGNKNVTCMDSLLDEYLKYVPTSWFKGIETISEPAEKHLPELDEKFDLVWCWNCLDHVNDWRKVLDNLKEYLSKDGMLVIGTDAKDSSIGHPGVGSPEILIEEIRKRFKSVDIDHRRLDRDLIFLLRK